MGYTKLHSTILDSSVWLEPAHVRLVWITMLAMADQHGVVHASVGGLAHRARVSKEEAMDAIKRFLGPDPDSRDRTTGERIEEVPGGWLVLNHANYRDKQTREQALTAERVARHRERKRTVTERYVTPGNAPLLMPMLMEPASAAVPSESPEPERVVVPKPSKTEAVLQSEYFQRFWNAYDYKKSREESAKSWAKINPDADLAEKIILAAKHYAEDNPDKAYRKHPSTWLNQKCWEDERVSKSKAIPDGGFDRFGNWKGVPRGKQNYSAELSEDDPEHPIQLLANENGIRASKSLPPLTMEQWKLLGDPRAR